MGHLNGILARVGGNLNDNFQKSQIPGGLPGGGGMLKLRFDRYITRVNTRARRFRYCMFNNTLHRQLLTVFIWNFLLLIAQWDS